jgi:hypothetical protein
VGAGVVEAEVAGRIGERQRGSQCLVLVDGPLLGGTGHHPIPGELPFHNGVSECGGVPQAGVAAAGEK